MSISLCTFAVSILSLLTFEVDSQDSSSPEKPTFFKFLKKRDLKDPVSEGPVAYPVDPKNPNYSGEKSVDETYQPSRAELIKDAGRILDEMERHLEEWGHASFSEVVLIPDSEQLKNHFGIENKTEYSVYDGNVRNGVQGSAFKGVATSTGAAVEIQIDNQGLVENDNIDKFAEDIAGSPASAKGRATAIDTFNVAIQQDTANGTNRITSVLTDQSLSLSESDIQKIASSTMVTGQVLNFMSNPIEISDIHQAYIGLTQVSVSPGLRTRKDYFCEVQVAVEYAREAGSGYEFSLTNHDALQNGRYEIPSVFAAFPLAQAQVLDNAFVSDRQTELLLNAAGQFAAAGKSGIARTLLRYSKQLRNEVSTRTALPVVVPSSDGKSITYRFQPSVHALSDPTRKGSNPGWLLQPVSVPALIVVVCEKEDLKKWDHISFTHSTRWVPVQKSTMLRTVTYDWWSNPFFANRRLSNVPRLKNSAKFDYLIKEYGFLLENTQFLALETRSRVVNIRNLIRSHTSIKQLPMARPEIYRVTPSNTSLEALAKGEQLVISGRNFSGLTGYPGQESPIAYLQGVGLRTIHCSDNEIRACLNEEDYSKLDHEGYCLEVTVRSPRGGLSEPKALELFDTPSSAPESGILDVYPKVIRAGQDNQLIVGGFGFKKGGEDMIAYASVGGLALKETVINDQTLVLTIPDDEISTKLKSGNLVIVGRRGILGVWRDGGIKDECFEIVFDHSASESEEEEEEVEKKEEGDSHAPAEDGEEGKAEGNGDPAKPAEGGGGATPDPAENGEEPAGGDPNKGSDDPETPGTPGTPGTPVEQPHVEAGGGEETGSKFGIRSLRDLFGRVGKKTEIAPEAEAEEGITAISF